MHCVLSLFCDGRVVEIFILRLVHLESGIFMMVSCFFCVFRLGLLNHCRNGLSSYLVLNEVSLCVLFCGCDHVESKPIGVVEFGVVNGC